MRRQPYDDVVLDTPPFVPFPDCRLIAKSVDGFRPGGRVQSNAAGRPG